MWEGGSARGQVGRARLLCRRAMTGVWKGRPSGMKRKRSWKVNNVPCKSSVGEAWRAGQCFSGLTGEPRNRLFCTSWRSDMGGVFRQVRYDNLKSAVKKILQGYPREETSRFIAFRSHWGFAAEFCNPGGGNEKGGVEGEVGYFRRNHWTPVPQAGSLEALNQFLQGAGRQDEERPIQARELCVGAALAQEREHLLPRQCKVSSW